MKVKTMRGQMLDVTALMAQHENTIAVGNAKMNARGDIIGAGGAIIKRREQAAQEYYQQNPKAVKKVSLRDVRPDAVKPAEAVAHAKQEITKQLAAKEHAKTQTQTRTRKIVDSEE